MTTKDKNQKAVFSFVWSKKMAVKRSFVEVEELKNMETFHQDTEQSFGPSCISKRCGWGSSSTDHFLRVGKVVDTSGCEQENISDALMVGWHNTTMITWIRWARHCLSVLLPEQTPLLAKQPMYITPLPPWSLPNKDVSRVRCVVDFVRVPSVVRRC